MPKVKYSPNFGPVGKVHSACNESTANAYRGEKRIYDREIVL